ncbi:hypothetical protein ACFMKF_23270, partial [Acinetobacter baumannii]
SIARLSSVPSEHIAQAAPLAVKATLASAREAVNEGYEVAFNQLQNHLQPLLTTEDVQEGVFAMLQKRPPVFKGK